MNCHFYTSIHKKIYVFISQPCLEELSCTVPVSSHLLPDEEVAEEAAHLSFGQCASRKRVIVAWQQVDTQDLNVTAVQCTAHTHTRKKENIVKHFQSRHLSALTMLSLYLSLCITHFPSTASTTLTSISNSFSENNIRSLRSWRRRRLIRYI